MLKELFEAIGKNAVAANAVGIIHPEAEASDIYAIQGAPFELTWRQAAPLPRNHIVMDLKAIGEFCEFISHASPAIVAWYSRQGVVVLVDDTTRRDRVTLPLELSPQVKALQALEGSRKSFTQKELILFLRTTLAKCADPSLVDIFRRVKFRATQGGDAELTHGKSSIGRQLTAELTGQQAIPEYVAFSLPIFAASFLAVGRVECAIEVLPDSEQFQLIPLPGQIEAAIAEAEAKLGEAINDSLGEHGAAFYGKP